MKHSFLITLLFSFALFSCKTKSLNSLYDRKNEKIDINILVENRSITSQEQGLLGAYLLLHARDSSLNGKAFSVLLTAAKIEDSIARQNRLLQERLNHTIGIKVLRKHFDVYFKDGSEHRTVALDINIINNSERRVAGFNVELAFLNSSGITFYSSQWAFTNSLNPHSEINVTISTGEYDTADSSLVQLNIADLNKVQYKSKIIKLLYDDGTSKSVASN